MPELPVRQKAMIVLNYSTTNAALPSPFEQLVKNLVTQGYQIKQQLNLDKGMTFILEKEYDG
ncbi:hypothetical protein D3P07_02115 [Paenibacillus sp. 1011MAR3C5]|nr:hypothetical protein D3P07_02115 [Paenibacillus sp. 1011MAR3C5]